jgi:hypothetical protein
MELEGDTTDGAFNRALGWALDALYRDDVA